MALYTVVRNQNIPGTFDVIRNRTEPLLVGLSREQASEACRGIVLGKFTAAEYDQTLRDAAEADWCATEAEVERYAEFGMSWVHGGGNASDVSAAYAMFGRCS